MGRLIKVAGRKAMTPELREPVSKSSGNSVVMSPARISPKISAPAKSAGKVREA